MHAQTRTQRTTTTLASRAGVTVTLAIGAWLLLAAFLGTIAVDLVAATEQAAILVWLVIVASPLPAAIATRLVRQRTTS